MQPFFNGAFDIHVVHGDGTLLAETVRATNRLLVTRAVDAGPHKNDVVGGGQIDACSGGADARDEDRRPGIRLERADGVAALQRWHAAVTAATFEPVGFEQADKLGNPGARMAKHERFGRCVARPNRLQELQQFGMFGRALYVMIRGGAHIVLCGEWGGTVQHAQSQLGLLLRASTHGAFGTRANECSRDAVGAIPMVARGHRRHVVDVHANRTHVLVAMRGHERRVGSLRPGQTRGVTVKEGAKRPVASGADGPENVRQRIQFRRMELSRRRV